MRPLSRRLEEKEGNEESNYSMGKGIKKGELCMDPILGSVISAIITGVLALVGVVISNQSSHHAIEAQLRTQQAVTDTKIDALTEEVKRHNSIVEKIPSLEIKLDNLERRITDLERDKSAS